MWCRSPTGRQTCPSRSDPDRGYFSTRPKGCQTREVTGSGSVSTVAAVYEVCSFLCCTRCLKYDRQKGRSMTGASRREFLKRLAAASVCATTPVSELLAQGVRYKPCMTIPSALDCSLRFHFRTSRAH